MLFDDRRLFAQRQRDDFLIVQNVNLKTEKQKKHRKSILEAADRRRYKTTTSSRRDAYENVGDRRPPVGRAGPVGRPNVEPEHRGVCELIETADGAYQARLLVHVEVSLLHGISDHGVPHVPVDALIQIDGLENATENVMISCATGGAVCECELDSRYDLAGNERTTKEILNVLKRA